MTAAGPMRRFCAAFRRSRRFCALPLREFVAQETDRWGLQIVELTGARRPEKARGGERGERDRQRQHDEQHGHEPRPSLEAASKVRARSALATTVIDDNG